MKSIYLMLVGVLTPYLSALGQLNGLHNHYRPNDVLIKQQVEYINPGEAGQNIIWNFNKLKTINSEYTLTYSLPPLEGDSVYIVGDKRFKAKDTDVDELIVGIEHNTMYYYRLTKDSLLQLGHENPTVKLEYTPPMVLMQFPLNYGQAINSNYQSEGLYSGTVNIHTHGTMTTLADAYGKLILPSGDTLGSVLRVKTIQTIFDTSSENNDTTNTTYNQGKQLETYRWYSKGYRYSVFETVRNINLSDNSVIFSTAFFYPPQEHYYLDTDPENLALLDELWNIEENTKKNQILDNTAKSVALEDIMACKIYPNPVQSIVNIEYELKKDANVSFELYSIEGYLVKRITPKHQKASVYYESIDCSNLYPKNYVLRIIADDLSVNQIVIKK